MKMTQISSSDVSHPVMSKFKHGGGYSSYRPPALLLLATLCLVGLSFAEPDENGFEYTSTEGYLSVSANVPQGTSDMEAGQSRTIEITATRITWEVWTHPSTSETIHKNETSEPASFASLSASVYSGSGVTANDATLDASGFGTATFHMSTTGEAMVQFSVSDLSGASGSVNVTFYPPYEPPPEDPPMEETWSYSHSEGALRVSLSSSGGTTEVPEGATIPVQFVAEYDTWDVEVSNYSNTRTANHSTSAASGASLSWSLSGDGSYSGDAEADWSGYASASITMGTTDGNIQVEASYSGGSASASLSFSAPSAPPSYPIFTGTRTAFQFEETTTLFEELQTGTDYVFSGQLNKRTEEVWQQEGGGETYVPVDSWESASNEVVSLYVVGDGGLSTTELTTNSAGEFSATLAMGVETSTVVVSPSATATPEQVFYFMLPSTPPPVEPYYLRSEGGWEISWNSGETIYADPGSIVALSGTVTSVSWDVWTDGITEWNENYNSMPANDVPYDFAVTEGTGSLSHSSVTTDSSGQFSLEATTASDGSSMVVAMSYSGGAPLAYVSIHPPEVEEEETWTDFGDPFWQHSVSTWASNYEGNPGSTATIYTQVTSQEMIQQVSNLGNTQTVAWSGNPDPVPGEGVAVSLQKANGIGGALGSSSLTTDNNGIATTTYTFGTTDGAVEVMCGGFYQVLEFVVSEAAITEHSGTIARVEFIQVPAAGSLAPLDAGQVIARVMSDEVTWTEKWWPNGINETSEYSIASSSPIEGAQVTWEIIGANAGSIVPDPENNGVTDSEGQFNATFTMGTEGTRLVRVTAAPLGATVTSTTTLTREPGWSHLHDVVVSLEVEVRPPEYPARSLRAWVRKRIQAVWQKGTQQRTMGVQMEAVGGALVRWTRESGTAQVESPHGTTFSTGTSGQGTLGTHDTRVAALPGATIRAEATFGNLSATSLYNMLDDVGAIDHDEDGLTTEHELLLGLNTWHSDSDGDDVSDYYEDPDADGWGNGDELTFGLNPLVFDQPPASEHFYTSINRLESSIGGGLSFSYTYDPEGNINH